LVQLVFMIRDRKLSVSLCVFRAPLPRTSTWGDTWCRGTGRHSDQALGPSQEAAQVGSGTSTGRSTWARLGWYWFTTGGGTLETDSVLTQNTLGHAGAETGTMLGEHWGSAG
jgi:hypothetical protein